MATLSAQLCMLFLLLQSLFAICQEAQTNNKLAVYICPGLNASNNQTQDQAESEYQCPCLKTGPVTVSQRTQLLLLCVSEEKGVADNNCWWYAPRGNETTNNDSAINGTIFDGKARLAEDKRCSFGNHIQSPDDFAKYACYHEVSEGSAHLKSGYWECSIKIAKGKNPTPSSSYSSYLNVKARCASNNDCRHEPGEICDSHAHYCRRTCDGPNGGTATCQRTISEHAVCRPHQHSAGNYTCTCPETTIPKYSEQGNNLTDCLKSCSNDTECTMNEKCAQTTSGDCPSSDDKDCSRKRCVDVCVDFPCGSEQHCQRNTSSIHKAECVCRSEEFIALPNRTSCVKPYLLQKKLSIQLQLKGRSTASTTNFTNFTSELSPADNDGFHYENFTLYPKETVRIICSLEAGYPYPTVNWTLLATSREVLHNQTFWVSDYTQTSSSNGPDYAKTANAAIVLGNLTRLQSESKNVQLVCKGNHKTLENQKDPPERRVRLVLKDCRVNDDCRKNQTCYLEDCKDVCDVAKALNNGNPCPRNNEECMPSEAHKYSCNCKRGFGRLAPGSQCLKKCSNLTNCKISQGETCFEGLCRKVCTAHPCGHGTTCQQDNKGGRSCMCKNGMVYRYSDTMCFPVVKADSKHLRVHIGNQDLKCHSQGNSVHCRMWRAEHGNSEWEIRIFFDHVFPQPPVEFLPDKTNLQSSVPKESAPVAKTVRAIQKSAIELDYTLTFTIQAAYADHGKSLEARISPVMGKVISLSIELNISDCKKDDDCVHNQVCAFSNVDNQKKCLDVCSEEQKSGRPNCPEHSKCSPRTEVAHKWHCECNAGHVLITLEGKQQCPRTCSEAEKCRDHFKTCQVWNDRQWTRNQSVCLPTCHNVHCGPSTRCEAVEKHAFKCHCEEGFFADDGQNSVQGRKINCYRPIAPNPDVPRISMQLGLLKEVDLCPNEPRESMAASTCSKFFVAENANISLKCHLERLFPAPENVIWEIVDNMDQVVQSVSSATNYAGSSNMARSFWSSKIWEDSGLPQSSVGAGQHAFDGTQSYVRSFFSEINLLNVGRKALDGRKIRCSVPHESLMNRMYSTTTTSAHFFGCSQHGCGGVDIFSVPKNPITIGSKAELQCKTDLPLLQHGSEGNDKPDCTWTMKRTNMRAAKMAISISFFSWNRTIENATNISPEQVNLQLREVMQDEPKTDCSIILNKVDLDLGGYWTCSATIFNGIKVDSGNQQDGALLYVFAPPTKVLADIIYMESNEVKDAAFNVSSPIPEKNLGRTSQRRKRVDFRGGKVELTFNCTAYETHPAPMFEWAIHSSGNMLRTIIAAEPGVELTGETPLLISSSSPTPMQSLMDGESQMGTARNDYASAPTLKTYVSNFTHTFHVLNEQLEVILAEVDVRCKVVQYSSRDGKHLDQGAKDVWDTITIVFQEVQNTVDIPLVGSLAGFSFLMLLLIIAAILVVGKMRRNKRETGQDFFMPDAVGRWLQRRRRQPRLQPASNNLGGSSSGTFVPNIPVPAMDMVTLSAPPPLPRTPSPAHPQQLSPASAQRNGPGDNRDSSIQDDNRSKMPDLVKSHPLLPACTPLNLDEVYSRPGQAFQPPEAFNAGVKLPKTHDDLIYADPVFVRSEVRGLKVEEKKKGKEEEKKANNLEIDESTDYATIVGCWEE